MYWDSRGHVRCKLSFQQCPMKSTDLQSSPKGYVSCTANGYINMYKNIVNYTHLYIIIMYVCVCACGVAEHSVYIVC